MKNEPQSPVLLYQTSDGATRLEVRMEDETIWLTQNQMAELFQTRTQNVSLHIQNLLADGEVNRSATSRNTQQFDRRAAGRRLSRKLWRWPYDHGPSAAAGRPKLEPCFPKPN